MLCMEQLHNVKILPESARNSESITLFTAQESELDLQEIGKFNKRSADHVRVELKRLQKLESTDWQNNAGDNNAEGKTLSKFNTKGNQEENKEVNTHRVEETEKPYPSGHIQRDLRTSKQYEIPFKAPAFMDTQDGRKILSQINLGGDTSLFHGKRSQDGQGPLKSDLTSSNPGSD